MDRTAEIAAAERPAPGRRAHRPRSRVAPRSLAARYFNNLVLSPLYRRYVEEMSLRGDERVLDYGSGAGAAARHLAPRLAAGGGHLTCMDVSARWQETLRGVLRAYPDVELRRGDVRDDGAAGRKLRRRARALDAARRPAVGQAVDRRGARRLLRPGGRLFSHEPTNPRHGMPAAEVRTLLAAAGLTEVVAEEGKKAHTRPVLPGRLVQAGVTQVRPWSYDQCLLPPAAYAKEPAACRRLFLPPPLRDSPEIPPDSGSGISLTMWVAEPFRGAIGNPSGGGKPGGRFAPRSGDHWSAPLLRRWAAAA